MGCCGSNRSAWPGSTQTGSTQTGSTQTGSTQAGSSQAGSSQAGARPTGASGTGATGTASGSIRLRWRRRVAASVTGPGTGASYLVSADRPVVAVDSRDASGLLATGFFERIR